LARRRQCASADRHAANVLWIIREVKTADRLKRER
jgi:hypothetical protein